LSVDYIEETDKISIDLQNYKKGTFIVQHKKQSKEYKSKNLEELLETILKVFIEKREKFIQECNEGTPIDENDEYNEDHEEHVIIEEDDNDDIIPDIVSLHSKVHSYNKGKGNKYIFWKRISDNDKRNGHFKIENTHK
jgi:hypothetical protein